MRPVYSVETRSDKNIKKKKKSHVFQLHQVLSFALICLLGALKKPLFTQYGSFTWWGRLERKWNTSYIAPSADIITCGGLESGWVFCQAVWLIVKGGQMEWQTSWCVHENWDELKRWTTVKPQACQSIQSLLLLFIPYISLLNAV